MNVLCALMSLILALVSFGGSPGDGAETGARATAGPGALVWSSAAETYYHADENCPSIAEGETVYRSTKENAEANGKYPCPACYALETFYTGDDRFYHSDPSCSGLSLTAEVTEAQARITGRVPCPVCVWHATDKLLAVVEGSTVFVDISTYDQSGIMVWLSDDDEHYHHYGTCDGIRDAYQGELKYALLAGKTACPVCCPAAGNTVYCSRDGVYYHRAEDCPVLSDGSAVTLAEALVLGKLRCPECIPRN